MHSARLTRTRAAWGVMSGPSADVGVVQLVDDAQGDGVAQARRQPVHRRVDVVAELGEPCELVQALEVGVGERRRVGGEAPQRALLDGAAAVVLGERRGHTSRAVCGSRVLRTRTRAAARDRLWERASNGTALFPDHTGDSEVHRSHDLIAGCQKKWCSQWRRDTATPRRVAIEIASWAWSRGTAQRITRRWTCA